MANKINFFRHIEIQLHNNNVAVVEKDRNWSYAEFAQHSLHVYEYLRKNNIKRIMICLPQGFYAYTIIWGAYLAGVTFCPVTITIPLERKKYYSSLFIPDIIISNDSDFFCETKYISISCLFYKPLIGKSHISQKNDIEALAYVIFTSGSTGLPKGVMIKRKGLENFLEWSTSEYDVKSDDRWGQFSNLGFDLSICDIFTAILKKVILVPISGKAEKLLPGKIIKNKRITFWHSVPSVIDILNKAKHLNIEYLGSLKTLVFCGERLFPSQLDLLFKINPALVIYNTYGPTESTIICSFIKITKENCRQFYHNTVSIGHALPGFEISLSKSEENLNEIIITSDYIAGGYLKTHKNLHDSNSPFNYIEEDGILRSAYKTGDYGELINENLFFVCRKDSQVKIMGHRVDLSEIDYHLREYGCKTNITLYHQGKIISFLIHEKFDHDEILKYLSSKLPSYYLPHMIINKQEFPYNANEKVDIKELVDNLNM